MKFNSIRFLFPFFLSISLSAAGQTTKKFVMDMIHHNPGDKLTESDFNNPKYLKSNGFDGQVMNDFVFAHAAITFDRLNPQIFPKGSKERAWVMEAAEKVKKNILAAHSAGIKVFYFTDMIVLPKKLVDLYKDEICDKNGKISLDRPKTIEIHKLMFDELFETFPDLDGLVIRTGETYLNNVPYHTGNNPITNGVESHVALINLLREEVCAKRNKMVFYRTWSFGGMHDSANYYLEVTNKIEPHPNLVFSIKHTQGDYHRTYNFNPTLGIGKHPQIVEVQCQREYEGKGAYPNYIMDGVINGFEEYKTNTPQKGLTCLNDLKNNPNFYGVYSWSRGGGWVGPYITNEFWCKLNAFVIGRWAKNTNLTEKEVFDQFMDENGIQEKSSREAFRKLCILSAKAVIRGHSSAKYHWDKNWCFWMRDEFLAGSDTLNISQKNFPSEGFLNQALNYFYNRGEINGVLEEKKESVAIWDSIVHLSKLVHLKNKRDNDYLLVSAQYGLLLHKIIASGWEVMGLGFVGDKTGNYDKEMIAKAIKKYDNTWKDYRLLKEKNDQCASLYRPNAFIFKGFPYYQEKGLGATVDRYRK